MTKLKFILASTILITSSVALAEKVTPTGVGCDTESGSCFIILKDAFVGTQCPNKTQLRFNDEKRGTQGQYSAALAAFMAGKKLEVDSTSCYDNFPTPSYLYVTD